MIFQLPSPLQRIENDLTREKEVHLYLKRDDLIHSTVTGNKWRKLKYHVEDAEMLGMKTILTVGGAFSNHITATAAACRELGFKSIGIIRGEELKPTSNTALKFAHEQGMQLFFIDRLQYLKRNEPGFAIEMVRKYKLEEEDIYFVPEGGASALGRKGCSELVDEIDMDFDYIVCAVGTGTTIAGIANNLKQHQKALGIAVLNNESLEKEIKKKIINHSLSIIHYPFGGYAKANPFLITFIKDFYAEQNIKLDYVYTGKMMFGIFDLMKENYFPKDSTIIAIHTGGVMNADVFEGENLTKPFEPI